MQGEIKCYPPIIRLRIYRTPKAIRTPMTTYMRAYACEETTSVSSLLSIFSFTKVDEESLTDEEETFFSSSLAFMRTPLRTTFVSAGLLPATAPFPFFFPTLSIAPSTVLSPCDVDGSLDPKAPDVVPGDNHITMLSACRDIPLIR